ncbi:hypothetical protein M409DRAFT_70565 [Zasmidium cellare ATCC 36951]|uniref:Peptidase A1 domain-containing protein n=1 Tax=Zasmidium cellare ATCC 36951 TaxID=1080233 RepID=A0A6A6C207_ZASCE|nr:uncharacterized protein M409DRAFT_70565 [Zasmidium cellare ATCC 36951]KAF2160200.1 hypothetical protein M409DRAFT_70565 [Zasmidium cellare ATCC 36951]
MTSQAKSISPSQRWLGNDGNWSTFAINVGTPPKTLFVLPSTSGRSTWVVLPQGCGAEADPSTCNTTRGEVFDPSLSSTFKRVGDPNKFYQLNFGPEEDLSPLLPPALNYTGASLPGTDVLGFGTDSNDAPTLDNQLIVGYATKVPYVGQLGLASANETVVSLQEPERSVLEALQSIDAISSQYWGYTAGAIYRDSFGSLTLGGYDANAGNVDNVLTVPMDQDTNRSLTLEIVSTSLSDVLQPLSTAAIPALIDSVVPEIWLPEALCREFENELGLVWNDTVGMYLVDDDLHNRLTTRNASVIFSLAASAGDTRTTVNITLPYAAWDLSVGYPLLGALYGNDSTRSMRYFPLKRGNSNDQYYLGRTFLQEAYVAADYDNQEFHVSPATFGSGAQDIRTVTFPRKSGLSGGAIAGIVIGVVAALAIAGGLLWWFCWRKRKGKKKERRSTLATSSIGDNTTIAEWQDGVQMQQVEQYKPAEVSGEELDRFKPELDATVTARGAPTERHELWGGSVRRASDQSRASISPLEERHRMSRYSHNRTVSSNSFGQPSPPMSDQPSPPIGHPSPPLVDQDSSWFGAPLYELHGRSRDSPRSPTSPMQAPEEVPLSSEHMLGPSERETRRSGFVEEFDRPAQSDDRQ